MRLEKRTVPRLVTIRDRIVLAAALVTIAGSNGAAVPHRETTFAVHFHHLHVAVPDPGEAMGAAAESLGGERAILQGHGPGVRIAREYVVFDRLNERARSGVDAGAETQGTSAAMAYARAIRWATDAGLAASPSEFGSLAVARGIPVGRATIVAFSSPDPAPIVERLRARGVQPFEQTMENAMFRLPSGEIVELIADTDRPDTHWCPMHPDVRAPGPAQCGICGMDLVRIPVPKIGEYSFEVRIAPAEDGSQHFTFAIGDPETGEPVRDFIEVHERLLHLFVISRDLAMFQHVHPQPRSDGSFELNQHLPSGEYMFIADFLPAGGTPQMTQRAVITPGYANRVFTPLPELRPSERQQETGGLIVRLEAPALAPLKSSTLRFVVSDASSGTPVADLEPYLGASGHLLVVSSDLATAVHGHPEGFQTGGPAVTFETIFPTAGLYKLWVQFQRRGRVLTVPFVVQVPRQ